jgi:signal transduction histidine kinase
VTVDGSADRYCVEVGVADRGPGIAGSAEAHLFHPFFTTKQHGTGLGLASSRAIIEAHEGSIGFDNVPGNGCRFWFRLPIASAAAE